MALLAAACGDAGPPPPGPVPAPPAGENDPAYAIAGPRAWSFVGDALTPGDPRLELEVTPPAGVGYVDLWLDGGAGVRLGVDGGVHWASVDIAALPAGEHEVLLAADGAQAAFARLVFRRTHPLYVVVSTDWDDPDVPDAYLENQALLHEWHPELLLTHFVGPYTFTDPGVTEARRTLLADWVKGMQGTFADEIGVHVHPWCSFIVSAGVTCIITPSFVYPAGDTTGYTVVLGSYSQQEFTTVLGRARAIFAERGLGTPTSFRAGGWSAELHTLRALAAAGFTVDSSANNWRRLEEWNQPDGTTLYAWNMEHWATIGDTSQPYYPSETDILADAAPHLPILEVPDNGILVDYVTTEEMIEIFDANWGGGALLAPKAYSVGYHPPNFSSDRRDTLSRALEYVDQHLHAYDAGPAVYVTLSSLTKVWPRP